MEIPGLEDNYYTNVLSWSINNNIAILLANCVFLLDNNSGSINKLYEAFDCEEITSLHFNKTGDKLVIGNILGEILIWDIEKKQNI